MKRLSVMTVGLTLAALPAIYGLAGNPALSQSVPVRIPVGAVRVAVAEPRSDDSATVRKVSEATESTASPSSHGISGRGLSDNSGPGSGTDLRRRGEDSAPSGHGTSHGGDESSSPSSASASASSSAHQSGREAKPDSKSVGSGKSGSGKSVIAKSSSSESGSGKSGGGSDH
jgi:hypothetical protein